MDSSSVRERGSAFPSPRPRAPAAAPDSRGALAPPSSSTSPRSVSTAANALTAQRHTLTRLQAFFASHRFDTEGPYDDLFVVLLSTARHLVDICDAQAAQLQKHERLLGGQTVDRTQSMTHASVSDSAEPHPRTEARLAALEQRLDRLSQQLVRMETRQSVANIQPGTSLSAHQPATTTATAEVDGRASPEAVQAREARVWALVERLDKLDEVQTRMQQTHAREMRRVTEHVKRLQEDQKTQACWARARLEDAASRLVALESREPRDGRATSEQTALARSTEPTALLEAEEAHRAWRQHKHAHPLLHPTLLERLFGDEAAAARFTDDVQDRLDGLEELSREMDARVARLHARLDDVAASLVTHAQLVEARLRSTDHVQQTLAQDVTGVLRACGDLSRAQQSEVRTPPRRTKEDDTGSTDDENGLAMDAPSRSVVAATHPVISAPRRSAGMTESKETTGASPPKQAAASSGHRHASTHAQGKPVPLASPHANIASHPYNAGHTSQHVDSASLTADRVEAVPESASCDEVPGCVTWPQLAAWLTHAAARVDTNATPPPPPFPSSDDLSPRTRAESALLRLCDARAMTSSSPASSVPGAVEKVGYLASTVEALADELNSFTGRLSVLEAYSPHLYAIAARPPVLGVELADIVPHPDEHACLPECMGGGSGGVRVVRVFDGYPARFAGFAAGDVVVAVQGHTVRHRAELFACLTELSTAHRARCQVHLEDAFLKANGVLEVPGVGAGAGADTAGTLASRASLLSSIPRPPNRQGGSPITTEEAWRAWQVEGLLPRQELQFTLWRRGQFLEVVLLVPASPEPMTGARHEGV